MAVTIVTNRDEECDDNGIVHFEDRRGLIVPTAVRTPGFLPGAAAGLVKAGKADGDRGISLPHL